MLFKATKTITKEAVIDMSAQFLVNFVSLTVSNPKESAEDIALKALNDIDVNNALWSGLISYTSLTNAEQSAFDCAYKMITNFQNANGNSAIVSVGKGSFDCFIIFITRYALKNLKNSSSIKQFAKSISDAKQYDIILNKFSGIITWSNFESFTEELIDNGIKKGVEPLWAR